MADRGQLGTATDKSCQAEGNEEEPSGRLEEAMTTADVDGGKECGSVIDHFPDGNAVRVGDVAHS